MTTYSELEKKVSYLCETLRRAGLPEANIDAVSQHWLEAASLAELEQVTDALEAIEDVSRFDGNRATEVLNDAMQLMARMKQIVERPEIRAVLAGNSRPADDAIKYPNIRIQLNDLGEKIGPIVRRVSYAMSDAGVNETEIERYKAEVEQSSDAIGTSRRWVYVE